MFTFEDIAIGKYFKFLWAPDADYFRSGTIDPAKEVKCLKMGDDVWLYVNGPASGHKGYGARGPCRITWVEA